MRALVLLLLAGAATGCVEPTVGPAQAAPRAAGGPFHVAVATPRSAPTPTRVQGSIDGFEPGQVAMVVGWAPSEKATLVVVAKTALQVLQVRRFVRTDAAAAVGDPTHPGLGFRVVVRSLTEPVDRVCVLARLPQGQVTLLAGSDQSWCPNP